MVLCSAAIDAIALDEKDFSTGSQQDAPKALTRYLNVRIGYSRVRLEDAPWTRG